MRQNVAVIYRLKSNRLLPIYMRPIQKTFLGVSYEIPIRLLNIPYTPATSLFRFFLFVI